MATYRYTCPNCGEEYELRKRVVLIKRRCPHCGKLITPREIDRQEDERWAAIDARRAAAAAQRRMQTIVMLGVFGLLITGCVCSSVFFSTKQTPATSVSNPRLKAASESSSGINKATTQDATHPPNRDAAVDLGNGVTLKMVRIPKGRFWMGSPKGEQGRSSDGENQHEEGIAKDFYLGVCEVTQAQWKAVMGPESNPSTFKGDSLPVETVSWHDAKAFIARLNEKNHGAGYSYRLPTEAEWEYACRGGDTSKASGPFHLSYGPGSALSTDRANFNGSVAYPVGMPVGENRARTTPAGQFEANRFGLHDMHGNVSEWCEDLYSPGSLDRVYRGGSWITFGWYCRAASRFGLSPDAKSLDLGFRLAASPNAN